MMVLSCFTSASPCVTTAFAFGLFSIAFVSQDTELGEARYFLERQPHTVITPEPCSNWQIAFKTCNS
ncbi:hypothetical protein NUACC26_051300 [Scytonema sp. NUACC26]